MNSLDKGNTNANKKYKGKTSGEHKKKQLNCYLIFCEKRRAAVKRDYPELSATKVTKELREAIMRTLTKIDFNYPLEHQTDHLKSRMKKQKLINGTFQSTEAKAKMKDLLK